jgi:hypothetical protein
MQQWLTELHLELCGGIMLWSCQEIFIFLLQYSLGLSEGLIVLLFVNV